MNVHDTGQISTEHPGREAAPAWEEGGHAPHPPSGPYSDPGRRRHRRAPRAVWFVLAAVVLLIAGGGVYFTQRGSSSTSASSATSNPVATATELAQLRQAAAQTVAPNTSSAAIDPATIAPLVSPGVVVINTTLNFQGARAAGTGIVLTPTGLVLTNNHVIEGETAISVTDLGNTKTFQAKVLGYDRSHDVALVQLTGATGLPTVTLANSALAQVGQAVVGVGNAGGTGKASSAAGTITALSQSITATDAGAGTSEHLTGLIETNAAIMPGDSGGPLVDASGHVLGMDTAGSASYNVPTANNQGFAIPINDAVAVAEQIAAGNASSTVHVGPTAFLGIATAAGPSGQGLGATIVGVVSGGPAANAGLTPGDTIVALDGRTISSSTALMQQMLLEPVGANVTLRYVRAGTEQTTTVVLGSGPPQ